MKHRIIKRRRDGVRQHYTIGRKRRYYRSGEIRPTRKEPGKKAKMLIELNIINDYLKIPDLPENRRLELQKQKESMEQEAKRLTGAPPIHFVTGRTMPEVGRGFIKRYTGTSGRLPGVVTSIVDVPSVPPWEREKKRRINIKKAAEFGQFTRAISIAEEKAINDAEQDREHKLSIDDLKKKKRGRPRIYTFWWSS